MASAFFLFKTLKFFKFFLLGAVHIVAAFFAFAGLEGKVFDIVLTGLLVTVFVGYNDTHKLFQDIDTDNLTGRTVAGRNEIAGIRKLGVQLFISKFLIIQTAHESSAVT